MSCPDDERRWSPGYLWRVLALIALSTGAVLCTAYPDLLSGGESHSEHRSTGELARADRPTP